MSAFKHLSLVLVLSSLAPGFAQAASNELPAACAALAKLDSPGYRVDAAQWVPAGEIPGGVPGSTVTVPDHCLFQVVIDPRESGMPELSYGTGIELRLPADWNGRFLFQGGGGLNGTLNVATGSVRGAPSALNRGFAVVSTDGGHRGRNNVDARFGVDQQAKLDFAYQAVEKTTYEAKALISRYYGRDPDYSYFVGCSTGGREAMLVAQRMPLEFDGVVSGNAAFHFAGLVANQIWSLQTVNRMAPRDDNGNPLYSEAISHGQLEAIKARLLSRCDALDGLADGMINDFQACDFTPAEMQCGTPGISAEQCLTPAQVGGLEDIFGGARNSRGDALYGKFHYDTGIAGSAWRGMHLGNNAGMPANAILGATTMKGYILTPPQPDLDPLAFDFDRDMALTEETAAINDAVGLLHSTFANRGGKFIGYHGMSDQGMSSGRILEWYENILPRSEAGPQDWARLYMVPGMTHCGGGESTDAFDMLTAIQDWVEEDKAPDRILATGAAFPDVSRPLCPYPLVARYNGGDPDSADSFSCQP